MEGDIMKKEDVSRGYDKGYDDAKSGRSSEQAYGDTIIGGFVDHSTDGPSDYGRGYRRGFKDGKKNQT